MSAHMQSTWTRSLSAAMASALLEKHVWMERRPLPPPAMSTAPSQPMPAPTPAPLPSATPFRWFPAPSAAPMSRSNRSHSFLAIAIVINGVDHVLMPAGLAMMICQPTFHTLVHRA